VGRLGLGQEDTDRVVGVLVDMSAEADRALAVEASVVEDRPGAGDIAAVVVGMALEDQALEGQDRVVVELKAQFCRMIYH